MKNENQAEYENEDQERENEKQEEYENEDQERKMKIRKNIKMKIIREKWKSWRKWGQMKQGIWWWVSSLYKDEKNQKEGSSIIKTCL